MQTAEKRPMPIEWDFPALFILYIGIMAGMAEAGKGFMLAFREFTASAMAALWGLISVPVVCSGTMLTFVGFPMEIILECTALHYMIIFIAGVLAFRRHTIQYRLSGIMLGTLAIFILNMARIGIIGFIGRYFTSIFDFVHDYLWQGVFALCVVLLWVIWLHGRKVFSQRFPVKFLTVAVSASLSFWLMVTFLESYIAMLSLISNALLPVLSPIFYVPALIVADGRLIGYVIGNEVIYSKTTLYVLNAALLLPIASMTFIRSQWKTFLKRLCAATILLGVQHMLVIAFDWMLETAIGPGVHSALIWCIVMSSFVAPMLIWLLVMRLFRAEPAADMRAPLQ